MLFRLLSISFCSFPFIFFFFHWVAGPEWWIHGDRDDWTSSALPDGWSQRQLDLLDQFGCTAWQFFFVPASPLPPILLRYTYEICFVLVTIVPTKKCRLYTGWFEQHTALDQAAHQLTHLGNLARCVLLLYGYSINFQFIYLMHNCIVHDCQANSIFDTLAYGSNVITQKYN